MPRGDRNKSDAVLMFLMREFELFGSTCSHYMTGFRIYCIGTAFERSRSNLINVPCYSVRWLPDLKCMSS